MNPCPDTNICYIDSLFTIDKKKWTGSRALVLAAQIVCGWCGPTFVVTYAQPALFRFGGYGATDEFTVRFCQCGAINLLSKRTLNPRSLPAG